MTQITHTRDDAMVKALADIADVHIDEPGRAHITGYAPDSREYRDGTEPGGDWDEECDRLLAEIREALPAGYVADWSDDDIRIDWEG